jgi:glutathione synthase/RimK-type ligase-like ATP-grasp enzyme
MGAQPDTAGAVQVALLLERRYLTQRQPRGLAAELRRRGCAVRVEDPGSGAVSLTDSAWLAGIDVCVARGRSEAVLNRLLSAERHGVPTLNRHAAVAGVVDKAAMAVALASAGLPTPPTMLGSPEQLAAELPSHLYPVILKPIRGDNCRGLKVCTSPAEVARHSPESDQPLLAQPYLSGDGADLKLYGVGDRVWPVRKPTPFSTNGSPWAVHGGLAEARLVDLTGDLRELALRCSELFGLELFGVDCVVTAAGPVVIEVNEFPNYTCVPDADEALADHVLAKAARAAPRRLEREVVG